ncbi:MAG: zinc-dependent metalloprotease [Armatimonadetes bacterium]|nr:zinc-dependent metalloprotease [Armatimonadota bacterium]
MTRTTAVISALLVGSLAFGQTPIEEKTEGMFRHGGLLTTYHDAKANKIMMLVRREDQREFLMVSGIRTGLGSNDVGLDRGQLGNSYVVEIKRMADKVVFFVPNLGFRAEEGSLAERRSVAEAFAPSVLWATKIVAEDDDGSVLIDLTSFVLRDAHGVGRRLRGQGTASLDADKSAIDFNECLSFPKNLEFEAFLTFDVSGPGNFVQSTTEIAESWSLVQHVSIVELPDDGFEMREADPRIGAFGVSYLDYAVPLSESMRKRFIARHRLEKKNPGAAMSEAVEPIVYYIDHATPEPVRSALIAGASWWNEAFEEAGFIDAFQVKILPEDAHPLDLRYNVIQWVHRSTRGWSYGASVSDPRTGEIIKGHVSLGSLRVRQDRLIFEGLLGVAKTGSGDDDDPVELALARIRQLSAHEVGHTIGLAHNFAASTYGRGSVMDYPAPLVTVKGGRLDVSDAYAVGIGEYDKHAVKWMYSEFAPGADEEAELERIVRDGRRRGLLFLSDQDARSASSADPRANLWDNGSNAVDGLRETMAVREIALKNFSRENLPDGEPLSTIQEVFVPIFLFHRYQIDAAAKAIGGVYYAHTVNGDGVRPFTHVPGREQREALQALLDCLDSEFLTVPTHVVQLIGPRGFGVGGSREIFGGRTGPTFDPVAASEAAADAALAAMMNPGRLERVVQQTERRPDLPALGEVLGAMTDVDVRSLKPISGHHPVYSLSFNPATCRPTR